MPPLNPNLLTPTGARIQPRDASEEAFIRLMGAILADHVQGVVDRITDPQVRTELITAAHRDAAAAADGRQKVSAQ